MCPSSPHPSPTSPAVELNEAAGAIVRSLRRGSELQGDDHERRLLLGRDATQGWRRRQVAATAPSCWTVRSGAVRRGRASDHATRSPCLFHFKPHGTSGRCRRTHRGRRPHPSIRSSSSGPRQPAARVETLPACLHMCIRAMDERWLCVSWR